jgi:hypothetical protein
MKKFTVRVELHKAGKEDYENLHTQMQKENFFRFAHLPNKGRVKFPTAEYNYEGPIEIGQVIEAAKRAASKVVPSFEILATEVANRDGYNLVTEPPLFGGLGGGLVSGLFGGKVL